MQRATIFCLSDGRSSGDEVVKAQGCFFLPGHHACLGRQRHYLLMQVSWQKTNENSTSKRGEKTKTRRWQGWESAHMSVVSRWYSTSPGKHDRPWNSPLPAAPTSPPFPLMNRSRRRARKAFLSYSAHVPGIVLAADGHGVTGGLVSLFAGGVALGVLLPAQSHEVLLRVGRRCLRHRVAEGREADLRCDWAPRRRGWYICGGTCRSECVCGGTAVPNHLQGIAENCSSTGVRSLCVQEWWLSLEQEL